MRWITLSVALLVSTSQAFAQVERPEYVAARGATLGNLLTQLNGELLMSAVASGDAQARIAVRASGSAEPPMGGGDECKEGMSPIESNAHPRLLVTTCNFDEQLAKISRGGRFASGASGPDFQELVDILNTNWATLDAVSSNGPHYYTAASVAFVYMMWADGNVPGVRYGAHPTRAEWGDKLLELMGDILTLTGEKDCGWQYCQPLAFATDWGWDLLEAKGLTDNLANLMANTCGTANSRAYAFPGLIPNTDITLLWAICAHFKLVLTGEGLQTTWVNGYDFEDRLFKQAGIFALQTMLIGNGAGDGLDGPSYMPQYFVEVMMPLAEAYRRAHGLSTAAFYGARPEMNWIKYWPIYVTFNRRPESPTRQYIAFYSNVDRDWGGNEDRIPAHQAAISALDGWDNDMRDLAKYVEEQWIGTALGTSTSMQRMGAIFFASAPSTAFTAKSPTTLGISPVRCDFTISSRCFLKRDHTSTDAPLVTLNHVKWGYSVNLRHDQCAAGYGIYLNGYVTGRKLSDSSGHKQGSGGGAGFCNGIYFHDTVSEGPSGGSNGRYSDWGGMRRPQTTFSTIASLTTNSAYDMMSAYKADVEDGSHATTCLWQNLQRSYTSATVPHAGYNPNRMSAYEAIRCYRRPTDEDSDKGYLVLADDTTSTSTDYIATDNINFGAQPTFDGTASAWTVRPNCAVYKAHPQNAENDCPSSGSHGHVASTDSSEITASLNANGHNHKIWVKYYGPSGLTLIRAGGQNEEGKTWTGQGSASPWSLEHVDPYGARWDHGGAGSSASVRQLMLSWSVRARLTTPNTTTNFLKVIAFGRSTDSAPSFSALYTGTNFRCAGADDFLTCVSSGGVTTHARTSGTAVFDGLPAGSYTVAWVSLASSTTHTFTPGSDINLGNGAGGAVDCTPSAAGWRCEFRMIVTGSGTGAARTITVS